MKPRSDAKLLNLPAHQQDQLAAWLLDENISYKKAVERVFKDFGVKCSTDGMSVFWREVCAPRKLRRSSSAASAVAEIAQSLDTDWDTANAQLLGQKVFDMMSDPGTDPEAVSFLAGTLEKYKSRLLKEKELNAKIAGSQVKFEQKEREIALAISRFKRDTCELFLKWQNDERAKAITSSGASNAEKIEQLGQAMFGEDWDK